MFSKLIKRFTKNLQSTNLQFLSVKILKHIQSKQNLIKLKNLKNYAI